MLNGGKYCQVDIFYKGSAVHWTLIQTDPWDAAGLSSWAQLHTCLKFNYDQNTKS